MDVSENYIQMCEKLPTEMLERRIEDDDYIIVIDRELTLYKGLAGLHKDPFLSPVPVRIIRLFKQDQLQEISKAGYVSSIAYSPIMAEDEFHYFINNRPSSNKPRYCDQFGSMEQLWLAFLLSEKYNKYWDGNDWILKK